MMLNDSVMLVGFCVGALVLLLALGACLTIRIVRLLQQIGPASFEALGFEMGEIRLSTISGAWRLFAFIWSRRARSIGDRRVARCAAALRAVHVAYFALFAALLALFLVATFRA